MKLGKYKHFKGDFYEVMAEGKHSETQEELIIYKKLDGDNSIWVRPKSMFLEKVKVEGKEVPRFRFIEK